MPPSSPSGRRSRSTSRSSTATPTSRMPSTIASPTAAPTSSCRGPCCSGSTSGPASSSRSTTSPPTPRTDWGQDDFIPSLLAANRWTGRFGDPLGTGPLLEIPVNCESYNLAYVPGSPRAAGARGARPPGTPTSRRPRAIVARRRRRVRGFGQRGTEAWHTMYTGYATQLWSCGGTRLRATAAARSPRPRRSRATERLRRGVARRRADRLDRAALVRARARLRAGQLRAHRRLRPLRRVSSRTRRSHALAGRIGVRAAARRPDGAIVPNLWTWSLVMNARSRRQAAAWRFIEWAIEPGVPAALGVRGQHEPDAGERLGRPACRASTCPAGATSPRSRASSSSARARVVVTPATNYIADRRALGGRAPRRLCR